MRCSMNLSNEKKKYSYLSKDSFPILCVVLASFFMCAAVSMWSLHNLARSNAKEVSSMVAARVYDILSSNTSEPVTVSRTMAAEKSLMDALEQEASKSEAENVAYFQEYLSRLKNKLNYDAAFVVSEKSRRYYTFKGLNKTVDPINDPHDVWYSAFLESGKPYDSDVDNDETKSGQWTIFVNARIEDNNGNLLGVCGVGVSMTNFRELFKELENEHHVKINLVNKNGLVQVDTDESKIESTVLDINIPAIQGRKDYVPIEAENGDFVVTKYLDDLGWYLVVRNDNLITGSNLINILTWNVLMFLLVIAVIMTTLIIMMRRNHRKSYLAQRLNEQIASTVQLYSFAREFDIIDNTFSDIMSETHNIDDAPLVKQGDAQNALRSHALKLADPVYHNQLNKFVEFSTLDQRLKDHNVITTEFLSVKDHWLRCRFVVSKRTPLGKVARVLCLTENIDEERRTRESLQVISERALAANQAKSAFLSNMSHEIRTPINTMLGMNEMILRECRDSAILSYAENVSSAGHILMALVNDILDFSKIEAGKMEIIPREYNLSSPINDLMQLLKFRAEEKGLTFSVDIDPQTPKRMRGDDIRIRQIITNLLTNAVKYTQSGTIVFGVEYDKIDDNRVLLHIYVKDSGQGIKKEDMKKLFAKFERIGEEEHRNIEGTGLGMPITMQLLKMMGSKLEVESIYGLGSRFFFNLEQEVISWEPLGNVEELDKNAPSHIAQQEEAFTAPDANVLVVDDNQMNLVVFKNLLKKTGIKVDIASSGDEALEMTEAKKYDLIFLDHMMPEKDGVETLHALRKQSYGPNSKTPAVCLTANAVSGAKEYYMKEGFHDYLSKPIIPAKLDKLLLKFLPSEKIHGTSDKIEG